VARQPRNPGVITKSLTEIQEGKLVSSIKNFLLKKDEKNTAFKPQDWHCDVADLQYLQDRHAYYTI
jgi:hypothetical protein